MNDSAWSLHLENLILRQKIQRLQADLCRERRIADTWRTRALHGRPPGRATPRVK